MDLAVVQKIIPANPTNACALPKVERQEMQTIPAEQLQVFLLEAKATGVYEMYYRRGELLGLKWQDIDRKNSVIKAHRQEARVDGQIKKPKPMTRMCSLPPTAVPSPRTAWTMCRSESLNGLASPRSESMTPNLRSHRLTEWRRHQDSVRHAGSFLG